MYQEWRLFRGLLQCLAIAMLTLTSSVHAHTHVVKSDPANGSVLSAPPSSIVLTFAEPARVTSMSLQLGTSAAQKLESLPGAAAREISVPLPSGLGDGQYVLTYRAVSADGHVMPGKLTFTVKASGSSPK